MRLAAHKLSIIWFGVQQGLQLHRPHVRVWTIVLMSMSGLSSSYIVYSMSNAA